MKIRHNEIIIPEENPFANCKLQREPYARVLTEIVNTYADGFVLAINNEWGTGKTTFVRMWQQLLINEGFHSVYFNAWENDFDSNPLVAIMSELETLADNKNEKIFKSVIEKGAVLIKNIAPAILKAVADKYIESKVILDAVENTTKATTEILETEIKKYNSRKKTIVEFRKELEKFVNQEDNSKPLIFIVDELDRCRPNYAVEVLEQIKHFFSVPGIVFVLSIDKKHLESSVKGFYGSEQIDSNEYFRRFIDLEYSIPTPDPKLFDNYLYEYYQLKDFFSSVDRKNSQFREDGQQLLVFADALFHKVNATLRQQEKVFALTRLILCSFKSNENTFPTLLIFLIYLKIMKNEVFQKIERHEYTIQELSDKFYEIIHSEKKDSYNLNLLYIESLLLWFYNNDNEYEYRVNLYNEDGSGNFTTPILSKLQADFPRITLVECFNQVSNDWNNRGFALKYLITKISLIEPITI
jgi:hypothetical protein